MEEMTITTLKEAIDVITEYGNKDFFFRGENKDFKDNFCLPAYIRTSKLGSCFQDDDHKWFIIKLEALGVGFPCFPNKVQETYSSLKNVAVF